MVEDIKFVADEAQAVLNILDRRFHNCPLRDEDWQALFSSEGYVRLRRREESVLPEAAKGPSAAEGPLADRDFQAFVLSDELAACYEALSATLYEWQEADFQISAERALAYLPKDTPLRARVYPVIKPQASSFVFEAERDPAIFLYLDPKVTRGQFEAALACEMHSIGMGAALRGLGRSPEWGALPAATRRMLEWVNAFGEGIAMLAAAGVPHAKHAPQAERWDQDGQNFEADFRKMEAFLLEVLNGKLEGQASKNAGSGFFGDPGPWRAVGWKMAATIERAAGRDAVIEAFCDPRKLLGWYNRAAGDGMPRWSEELVEAGFRSL